MDDGDKQPNKRKSEDKTLQFHEMELDDRILKALAKLGWQDPTLIQERAIPFLLDGKDVLIRARTGSGKTGAFAIPVIQRILLSKQVAKEQAVRALILAPSKELCSQIHSHILELTQKCSREVRCVDISPQVEVVAQKPLLVERPDVVIATPARALLHLNTKSLSITNSLEMLVIDEADLMFSFGYEDDVKEVLKFLPRVYQAMLASATLSEDVLSLKKLILHNPVILKLQESELAPVTQLTHYIINAEEQDKAAILYAFLMLSLIRGKTIIFVNTVDRCYKLKLFLEQFAIKTCLLNSELPANVRCHSVSQFNQGVYDIIIASDEHSLDQPDAGSSVDLKQKRKRKRDKESGVARGIDFQQVSNVINFDFPLSVSSYIHRAGRTARGVNQGSALSFVSVKERPMMEVVEEHLKTDLCHNGNLFKNYQFNLEEVEGFRYRAKDAWRAVTRIAVREARLKEIKEEMLNNDKLKGFFEENSRDFKALRHDRALHTVKVQRHLAHVPDYLVPPSLKRLIPRTVSAHTSTSARHSGSYSRRKYKARQKNPLRSMEFDGFKDSARKK
ncbi:probable ATP-dependent RNA helicase DDX56 [Macrosteles quadrilineatus]|uniref:probable ATP-dependent RNA helicase DDX56 n=1 Tax=Macrosteles quadrilineatus TaxID=74068 RepID=UPI0023E0B4F8|nr:probable ATP-dependent RNA helicase DDX56 [Macrosteles quadrilineatus]